MEKTQLSEATPINGGKTCSYCRHLDTSNRTALCRRHPPQMVGGVVMGQAPGALEPRPIIVSEGYWPKIGNPEEHWCGEWYGHTLWKDSPSSPPDSGAPF